ncbi:MAG: replicative DNA helicase [Gammaproteobacteria bacterium]
MSRSALPESVAPPVESLKVPPHSIEAEQSLLGGLMLDSSAWEDVADQVDDEDFYRSDHSLIYSAIRSLAEESRPHDIVTLSEWLGNRGELERVGGLPYLAALVENTPTAENVRHYAGIVRDRAILRLLVRVGGEIAKSGFSTRGSSSKELLDRAERMVFEIAERHARGRSGYRGIKDLLNNALERIQKLYESDNPLTGVATGFSDFDELTSGLQAADLVIVAGRPSMGKTAFAVNIAERAVIKDKLTVAIFSMEMPGEQLAMRMMASLGRIDQHKVRTGKLSDEDWPRLTSAVTMLAEASLFIDDTPALTPNELRARCRRIARQKGLGLVIVDYLQLMEVLGTTENRATEISQISRSLKALAKELNCPIVALSQLNRSLESRTDKRPVMSDLRESGAIEQDADLIVFIYRDEVYHEDSQHKGTAEIIVAKQRNGPIGKVRMAFLGQYTRFEDLASERYYDSAGGYE